jgi:hypothetical protein
MSRVNSQSTFGSANYKSHVALCRRRASAQQSSRPTEEVQRSQFTQIGPIAEVLLLTAGHSSLVLCQRTVTLQVFDG